MLEAIAELVIMLLVNVYQESTSPVFLLGLRTKLKMSYLRTVGIGTALGHISICRYVKIVPAKWGVLFWFASFLPSFD